MNIVPSDKVEISTNIEAPVDVTPMPSTITSNSNSNNTIHTLMNLLTRFVVIDKFTWKTSDVVLPLWLSASAYANNTETALRRYLLPQALLESSALLRQKLNNFLFMRADVEFEIKVNANPFQQGELMMAYFPKSLETSKFRRSGNEFMASVTSAPHQFIKLEQGNTAKMVVPYANIVEYLDLSQPDNAFGVLALYAISRLEGPSDNETADITVRARFVNPKVSVPTDSSILASDKYSGIELKALQDSISRTRQRSQRRRPVGLVAQMAEGEQTGPVSKISGAIATIGDTLAPLPVVGRIGEVTAWLARSVQGVAAVFGWSKPVDNIMPVKHVHTPAAYMGNTEGKDASHVLAQIVDNAVDTSCMVPSNKDEMALEAIFERPNVIGRFKVDRSDFNGRKLLFSWEVSPFNGLTQQPDSNGQDLALGSFSFASMMCLLWRGSIKYGLRMVKTQYHSGRVVAVYFPNKTRSELPEVLTEELHTNSNVIIDLAAKSNTETTLDNPIVIPYTSNIPWKRTLWKNPNTDLYDASTLETSIGCVGVYVYNELVCPETVAQNITFLLSVTAGKDYEIAIPQIQLAGGFATSSTLDVNSTFVSNLNSLLPEDLMTEVVQSVGDVCDFETVNTSTASLQIQQVDANSYIYMLGEITSIPDGTYSAEVNVVDNTNHVRGGDFTFTYTIEDGAYTSVSADTDMTATLSGQHEVELVYTLINTQRFKAQMDEGASDAMPADELVAQVLPTSNAQISTTGEYLKSLRPLTKRFIRTASLDLTNSKRVFPFAFTNIDENSSSFPIGNRTWATSSGSGGLLPESWVSLISYLFRFSAGSARTKLFTEFNDQISTSLTMNTNLNVEFSGPLGDPEFITNGVINHAVETQIPYYSQYKCRVIGDKLYGIGPKVRYTSIRAKEFPYFEAAGDDYNMWFMVGPPVMRPADVLPVAVGVITAE